MPFITINKKSLFYTIDGDESSSTKTTALLVHGLGSSSCFYKAITPELSSAVRCISLDTPSSGLSEHGPGKQTLATIVKDIVGLLDALQVKEQIVIVGHSMGGIIASSVASEYPERVRGVVLLGPVDPAPALTEVFLQRIEVVRKDGLETLANTIPAAATGSKAGPLQHAFIRSLILGTTPEGYMCLCDVIANATKPKYEVVKVPLMILAGSEDKTAPLSSSEVILKAYGTSSAQKKIEILEGVGHWHCIEAPEKVGQHILSFIASLS